MHLLAARPGGFVDEEGIVDLQQSPADVVILSAQDTSLGLLAAVAEELPEDYPSVRLANVIHLTKPAAFDLYADRVIEHARLVVVSVLGGRAYWQYGIDRLIELSARQDFDLILVPGDDQPDDELFALSRCPNGAPRLVWQYLRHGGEANTRNLYHFLAAHCLELPIAGDWQKPRSYAPTVLYQAGGGQNDLDRWLDQQNPAKPTALLLFYRSHLQSGNTGAFDQLIETLDQTFNVLAVAARSVKDQACLDTINYLLQKCRADVIINTTSFSQHVEGNAALSSSPQLEQSPLFNTGIPVIQAILAASSTADWRQNPQGLRGRDIAMNVALPEYDGRIISRAISFKELSERSERTQSDVIRYRLHTERAEFVHQLAAGWARLGHTANQDKRIALILANYPTKDGRIGNGVGLDTPASVVNILRRLRQEGYTTGDFPEDGDALVSALLGGVTNNLDSIPLKAARQSLDLDTYQEYFDAMPEVCQRAVLDRWGPPSSDPKYRNGRLIVSGVRFASIFVGIQPARGFNVDVVANYHDPDLVPPHAYLAFYFWIRHVFAVDAIIHVGKHGNLEWLPGKSVGLSNHCWPDVALGPLPHLYPFIVNDPGEGAQAKRRAQAVIIDHLIPPMARAEVYGEMAQLEQLVDEYYQACGLDRRREHFLKQQILALLRSSHLGEEIGGGGTNDDNLLLGRVDTYLCDLKEAQIRHGLHTLGDRGDPKRLAETLVALTRLPRGNQAKDSGILHAIASDLSLANGDAPFDPLNFEPSARWRGEKPAALQNISDQPWRTEADARERLELLALKLIEALLQRNTINPAMPASAILFANIRDTLLPALSRSAELETGNLAAALDGGFVAAGPSGAPTRGRLDVLPTGRNFYSLDSRSIPTRTAWALGRQSAELLIQRHMQEQGEYPAQIGLSAWGTSTMRTGGDDIAQGLALLGVKPVWAEGSNRVIDIEVIPGFQLGRPRVDVTLRISGFFRDAFPNVARLFDRAVQTLANYEEPGDSNTIRRHIERDLTQKIAAGADPESAAVEARFRVFGAKPGSYGAGLQGLIDERVWKDKADLAQAYVNWGGYSYSQDSFGQPAFDAFEQRLGQIEAVVHNQDNREHDLLDSDDYYQFQGGMANAAEVLAGQQPLIYHGDHANPATPVIRTLKEELNRVIRSRVLNPKWISAMRQHGYKGAFEMAASVDYLFAYDATTSLIDDYQYEAVTNALLNDAENRAFLQSTNPDALKEMAERLIEAQQRGLWQQPGEYSGLLTDLLLAVEDQLEST